jgi:hypothetical protein
MTESTMDFDQMLETWLARTLRQATTVVEPRRISPILLAHFTCLSIQPRSKSAI